MISLKYSIREILKTYKLSILLIILITFLTISIYNTITTKFYFNEKVRAMDFIESRGDIYGISLINGEEVYVKRQCKDTDKVINYIKSLKDVKSAIINNTELQIKSFNGDKEFRQDDNNFSMPSSLNYMYINSIEVGDTFFEGFDIKLSDGNKNNLFKNYNDGIPVVLGNAYKGIYSIGSIVDAMYYDEKIKFKVVGFLDKGQYFTTNGNNFNNLFIGNMDNFILIPIDKSIQNRDISSYSLIFDKNFKEKDKIFKDIQEEGKKYDIQISFSPLTAEIEGLNNTKKQELGIRLLFLFIIMIFSIVTLLVVFINKISIRKKEFGVHIMSGARLYDISKMVLIEFLIITLLSLILSGSYLLYQKLEIDSLYIEFNLIYYLLTCIIIIFIMILLSIVPIRKILNIDINTLVRGEE